MRFKLILCSFLLLTSFSNAAYQFSDIEIIKMYCNRQIYYYEKFLQIHESQDKPLTHEQEIKYEFDKGVLAGYKDVLYFIDIHD